MAVTYTCPKCNRSVTVYVGKSVPVCTRCRKRMVAVNKSKTA